MLSYVVDVSLQLYTFEFLTLEVGIMYGPDGQLRKGNVPWTGNCPVDGFVISIGLASFGIFQRTFRANYV